MKKFDFDKWNYILCVTKDEANSELCKYDIIGDEIEEIVILDTDWINSDEHRLRSIYENRVLNKSVESSEESIANIKKSRDNHKKITFDMFPSDFKDMFPTYSKMPLILKLSSGKYFELFFTENVDSKDNCLTWSKELMLSINQLEDCIKDSTPLMDYNKLYKIILHKKIININYLGKIFYNSKDNKDGEDNQIGAINIEFENGYVMRLFKSGPETGYFIAIYDIENESYDNFSIIDFKECFLGDINSINK